MTVTVSRQAAAADAMMTTGRRLPDSESEARHCPSLRLSGSGSEAAQPQSESLRRRLGLRIEFGVY